MFVQIPAQAANNHVGLMPEDRLPLYNKDTENKLDRSIIRSTQTEQRRAIVLIVSWPTIQYPQ